MWYSSVEIGYLISEIVPFSKNEKEVIGNLEPFGFDLNSFILFLSLKLNEGKSYFSSFVVVSDFNKTKQALYK